MAICLLFYLPGLFALPPIDRDEARFAEATRGIVAGDSWREVFVPQFDNRPRINKPPLTYWVQAPFVIATAGPRVGPAEVPAAGRIADTAESQERTTAEAVEQAGWRIVLSPPLALGEIWAYRLASVLGALVSVFLTWRLGLRMFAPAAAWWGALLLGTCVLITFDAHQARADQLLLAATVGAQLALWHVWRSRTAPGAPGAAVIGFWIAVWLGVLAKGPITPAIAGFTAAALCFFTREPRWVWRLRPLPGGLFVLVATAWWIAVVAHDVGWTRLSLFIAQETVVRSVTAFESHFAPPGYHALLLAILFWPGSLALWPGLWRGFALGLRGQPTGWWRRLFDYRGGRDAELFLLCWLVPGWLVFELIATKLPHYPLPVYPALALLCGRGLLAGWRWWRPAFETGIGQLLRTGWWLVGAVLCVPLPIALAIAGQMTDAPPLWTAFGAVMVVGLILLVMCAGALRGGFATLRPLARLSICVGAVASLALFQFTLPHLQRLWLAPRAAALLDALDPDARRPVIDIGLQADSLVFLRGGALKRYKPDEAPALESLPADAFVLLDGEPERLPPHWRILAQLSGAEYSSGRWVELFIVGRAPAGQAYVPRWIDIRDGWRPTCPDPVIDYVPCAPPATVWRPG